VVLRALEKDPTRRFQSAAEFSDALAAAATSLPPDSYASLGSSAWGAGQVSSAPATTPAAGAPVPTFGAGSTAHSRSLSSAPPKPSRNGRSLLPYFAVGTFGLLALGAVAAVFVIGATVVALWQRDSADAPTEPVEGLHAEADPSPPARAREPTLGSQVSQPDSVQAEGTAGFDKKHFDAWGFFPQAQKMARDAMPDAEFFRVDFSGINGHGVIDFTVSAGSFDSSAMYRFRSPAESKPAPGAPLNAKPEGPCLYYVVVNENGVRGIETSSDCQERTFPPPRCTPAQVWKKAQAMGAPTGNYIGRVSYYSAFGRKPRWLVTIGSDNHQSRWVEDSC
jgi:hypothetical protein